MFVQASRPLRSGATNISLSAPIGAVPPSQRTCLQMIIFPFSRRTAMSAIAILLAFQAENSRFPRPNLCPFGSIVVPLESVEGPFGSR
jgi:hypothetical protein